MQSPVKPNDMIRELNGMSDEFITINMNGNVSSGNISSTNKNFRIVVTNAGTFTLSGGDVFGRAVEIYTDTEISLYYTVHSISQASGVSSTITLSPGNFYRFRWNGVGWVADYLLEFSGTDNTGTEFSYEAIARSGM